MSRSLEKQKITLQQRIVDYKNTVQEFFDDYRWTFTKWLSTLSKNFEGKVKHWLYSTDLFVDLLTEMKQCIERDLRMLEELEEEELTEEEKEEEEENE